MLSLSQELTIVTCAKGNIQELESTLDSIHQFKFGFPRQILILSDFSEMEIEHLKKRFRELYLEIHQMPARGIYEAMNLAISKIHYGHVLFLNSGDSIVSESALIKLLLRCQPNGWGYGQAVIMKSLEDSTKIYNFSPYIRSLHFLGLRFIPHPSSLIPINLIRRFNSFDPNYPVAADQKLMLQCTQVSEPVVLNEAISRFHLGGISTRSTRDIIQDFRNICRELLPKSHFFNLPIFNPWSLVKLLRGIRVSLLQKGTG
jgi:hypothetical protein